MKFQIEDPRSGQILELEGDAPPSEDEIVQIFKSRGQAQAQSRQSLLGRAQSGVSDPLNEALNTFTFGAADKIRDTASGLAQDFTQFITEDVFGKKFKEPQNQLTAKQERQQFQRTNPKTAFVASTIGALANPIGQKVGQFIGRGTGLASTSGRAAIGGGGLSGAQAFGESEGPFSQRLGAGAKGAVLGGTVGAALPLGVRLAGTTARGIGGVGRGIRDRVFKSSAQRESTRAARKVSEALQRDGFNANEAAARIDRLGPEAAIIDVGDNTRGLAFSVGNIPGKGKPIVKEFIESRQIGTRNAKVDIVGGQVNRIRNSITKLVPEPFRSTQAKLRAAKGAEKLYQEAYSGNQFMESPTLNRLLKRPSMKRALKRVAGLGREEGENISRVDPELTALLKETGEAPTGAGVGRGLKLKTLDRIKRILFDMEDKAKGEFGKSTETSRSINSTRRALIRELDIIDQQTTGGAYAAARLAAGDDIANREALERGFKFMSRAEFGSIEELGEALAQMPPETRHFFRVGAANAMKTLAGGLNPRSDATKKLFEQVGLEQKINLAFGDRELFKQYIRTLQNEKELFKSVTDVLSNSKTTERLASIKDLGIDPGEAAQGVFDLAQGNVIPAGIKLARAAAGKVKPSLESDAIAQLLVGRDLSALREFLPEPFIGPLQQNLPVEGLLRDLLIRGSVASVGSNSAR